MSLFEAIERDDTEEVKRLIAGGADVNDRDFDDWQCTPLEFACQQGNEQIVEALLDAGAAPAGGLFEACSPLSPTASRQSCNVGPLGHRRGA